MAANLEVSGGIPTGNNAGYIRDQTHTTSALAIGQNRVGIGTAAPSEKLTIIDTQTLSIGEGKGYVGASEIQIKAPLGALLLGLDSKTNGNEFLRFATAAGENHIQSFEAQAGNPTTAKLRLTSGVSGTEGITLDTGNNVGIGTTTPGAKLVVNDQNMTGDGPLFLVDLNSNNILGVPPPPIPWMFGSQFKTNLSSTHDRFYIGQHNQLIDNHVGFGDHIGHASHAYGYVDRNAGGGSTGGDLWAYYGIVSNRDGGGTGHTVHGVGMELNTINCEKNYSEDLDNLDGIPSDFMLGIAIWPELQTSYQNTRGLSIWANTNTSPYCGYDTAIHCMNFVNTGIYLNSGNAAKTRLSGIRFGDDLDYDLIIHRKNTTNDYWGLANPSTDYIVWRYDVRNAPKDILSLTSSGSVGIGTANPNSLIDGTGPADDSEVNFKTSSTYSQLVLHDSDTSTSGLRIGYRFQAGVAEYGRIQAYNSVGATPLAINPNGGNVGIGTPSPGCKLDINVPNSGIQTVLAFSNSSGGYADIAQFDYNATSSPWPLTLSLKHSRPFVISGGNVGINDVAPDKKLDVGGDINIHSGSALYVNDTKVVGSQQPHIINANGTLADITTKFNTLLSELQTHGLLHP